MMKYQGIYDNSPIFIQNFMATMYGYKIKKERFGEYYYEHLDFLNSFNNFSKKKQEEHQFEEVMKLIEYASKNSRFYRELYKEVNITEFKNINDLTKLPIVTKEMVRQNIEDIITIPKGKAIKSNTGGTTGKSLTVYYKKEDNQRRMATLDYFKAIHGFMNIKMKRATFNGKHIIPPNQKQKKFWRYNVAIKQMIYSSFYISDENIPYYIESLNKYKPESIDGFISSIYDIASYIERNNIKLKFIPKAIFPTSETVTQEHRDVIERVFNSKIRDQYASSEGAPFVWECESGKLHYDISTGIIENIENSNEILITSFTTYGTPLIRYKIGDSMTFENNNTSCDCGLKTPLIESIQGRVVDFLYSTKGAKIYLGNVSNIFKNIPNAIAKAQLIQSSLTNMVVRMVVDKNFKEEHKSMLIDEIKHKFGNDMRIEIEIVEEIPREKSGKYKLIVNNVVTR
ncbi:phenylacetate--CoA ligase family protein [Peribacillus simplex]|uniref:phenylacetate--CoA ligase family protein n=1 Tax=Peribacillus simplex TaxID=1478 RepID=UPI003D2E7BC9